MTQDEIIEMARKAKILQPEAVLTYLEAFAKLVAQHEREACAVVCDDLWEDDGTAYECAEAIRARSNA